MRGKNDPGVLLFDLLTAVTSTDVSPDEATTAPSAIRAYVPLSNFSVRLKYMYKVKTGGGGGDGAHRLIFEHFVELRCERNES